MIYIPINNYKTFQKNLSKLNAFFIKNHNFFPKKTSLFFKKKPIITPNYINIFYKNPYTFSQKNNNQHFNKFKTLNSRKYLNFINTYNTLYTRFHLFYKLNTLSPSENTLSFKTLPIKTLLLNYNRLKFFPTLLNTKHKHTYITMSLGLFWSFFAKPKSFKKSKQLYILLSSFFHKLIIFSQINSLTLCIKFLPKFFPEILNTLLSKNTLTSKNPFFSSEKLFFHKKPNFFIKNLIFLKTKHYGFVKARKRGTVKRKVLRKVFKNNNITD
jgi:hypothetical protein